MCTSVGEVDILYSRVQTYIILFNGHKIYLKETLYQSLCRIYSTNAL